MSAQRVVVVGGGLAGVSAALVAGRRRSRGHAARAAAAARRLTWSFQRNGLSFDNGQHVFLRCCTAYLRFLDRIGARDAVYLQPRLDIPVLSPDGTRASITPRLACGPRCIWPRRWPATGISRWATGLRLAWPALALSRLNPEDPCARHGHLRELALPARAERRRDRPALESHRAADPERPGGGSLTGAGREGVPHRPPRSGRCRRRRVVDRAADRAAR